MKQLIFQIDPKATKKNNALTIAFAEGIKEGASWKLSTTTTFPLSQLKSLATTKDLPALSLLIKEENLFRRSTKSSSSGNYPYARIDLSRAYEAIKLLSSTGKFLKDRSTIVCDLLMPASLAYEAIPSEQSFCEIIATIKWGSRTHNIKDFDLVIPGPPHWFLKGSFLKTFDPNLHKKWLSRYLEATPFLLDHTSWQKLYNELKDNDIPSAPKLIVSKGLFSQPPPSKPASTILPYLQLAERHGSFANLWLEYEDGRKKPYHSLTPEPVAEEKCWEEDLLETGFIKRNIGSTHYFCPTHEVSKSLSFLLECGWKILDSTGSTLLPMTNSHLSMKLENNRIVTRGNFEYGNHKADVSDVIGAFNRRESFISLGEGFTGLISSDSNQKELSLLGEGEIHSDTIIMKKSQLGTFSEIVDSSSDLSLDNSLKKIKNELSNFSGITKSPPGKAFTGTLRPYQQEGVNWLTFLQKYELHGILADDMGLGKTVQVLAFLSRLEKNLPTLIILPTTLLFHWKKEIKNFLPSWKVYLHSGPSRIKKNEEFPEADIILCSYSILRLDISLLSQQSWNAIILDEAQAIKNPDTQAARAALQLKAPFRLSITGTPVENNLQELWSHFRFLMPELLGSRQHFLAQAQAAQLDPRHLKKIKRKVSPFLLRRRKDEVAKDLPEKIEQTIMVEMTPSQQNHYDQLLANIHKGTLKKVLAEGSSKNKMEIFEALLRLRQLCCHPLLVDSLLEQEQPRESSKFRALIDDLETVVTEGNKVLVYSQFTTMLTLISKEVDKRGWKQLRLDGATKNREEVVKQFQEDKSVQIFLLSLKAGGVGLNLTAADYVFLYEPWWNLAAENQAIDRAHRIGRKERVIAKRYITLNSIEEKILSIKEAKGDLSKGILDQEGSLQNLTSEELIALLS